MCNLHHTKKMGVFTLLGVLATLSSAYGSDHGHHWSHPATTATPTDMLKLSFLSIDVQDELVKIASGELINLTTTAPGESSMNCAVGGSRSITFSDNDNSNSVTAGDTYTSSLANCDDGYGFTYLSGVIQGTIVNNSGDFPAPTGKYQQSLAVNNLQVLKANNMRIFNGSAEVAWEANAAEHSYQSSTNIDDLSIATFVDGSAVALRYAPGSSFVYPLDTESGAFEFEHNFKVCGWFKNETFCAEYSAEPKLSGTILDPIKWRTTAKPTQGSWLVQWSRQAPVRLSAMPDGVHVLAETNPDGNGASTAQETLVWSDIAQLVK